jgi:hypothetical protein
MKIPILINLYNRPKYTRKLINSLSIIKPSVIYVSIDGPKNKLDEKKIKKILNLIKNINWKCKKIYKLNKINYGCKISVSNAIEWFFKNEKYGIILEDDVLPSKHFINFSEKYLIKYKNNKRISMITGFNPLNINPENKDLNFFLSQHYPIWGWASWARAWKGYKKELRNKDLKIFFKNNSFSSLLEKIHLKQKFATHNTYWKDTWDIQWVFHCMKKKTYCLTPNSNLIENIDDKYFFNQNNLIKKINNFKFIIKLNSKLKVNKSYDSIVYKKYAYPYLLKIAIKNCVYLFKKKYFK